MMDSPLTQAASNPAANAAVLRMTRSRIALRQALQTGQPNDVPPKHAAGDFASGMLSSFKLLKGNPSAQLLFSAIHQMWVKNPWRVLVMSSLQAADVVLKPVAQRSPIKLMAGAVAIGAVLALMRPWRLITKSALLSALLD